MTLYGFLATIVICGTLILMRWLFRKHPISFKIIKTVEPPKLVEPKPLSKEELEKLKDAPIQAVPAPDKEVEVTSMDAVIKAANELMGIETMTKENDNDR